MRAMKSQSLLTESGKTWFSVPFKRSRSQPSAQCAQKNTEFTAPVFCTLENNDLVSRIPLKTRSFGFRWKKNVPGLDFALVDGERNPVSCSKVGWTSLPKGNFGFSSSSGGGGKSMPALLSSCMFTCRINPGCGGSFEVKIVCRKEQNINWFKWGVWWGDWWGRERARDRRGRYGGDLLSFASSKSQSFLQLATQEENKMTFTFEDTWTDAANWKNAFPTKRASQHASYTSIPLPKLFFDHVGTSSS